MSRDPRDIDTEPDDAFEAVFGNLGGRPVLPRSGDAVPDPPAPKAPDVAGNSDAGPPPGRELDLEAMDLSDEIDPSLWAGADPEHGGVDESRALKDDSVPTLAPGRDLDAEAARELRDGLLEFMALGCVRVRLDLTGVSRIDAPGLAVMAAGAEDMARQGGGIEFSGAGGPVAELLKTLKLQHGFEAGTQE